MRLLHARLGDYLEELHPEDHGPHAQEGGQLGRKGQAQANDDGHFRVGGLGGGRIGDELIFELVRHRGSLHPGHQDKVLGPQHDRGRAVGGREDEAVTQKANDDRVRAEAGVLSTWKRKWQSEGTEGEHDVPRACTYIRPHTRAHMSRQEKGILTGDKLSVNSVKWSQVQSASVSVTRELKQPDVALPTSFQADSVSFRLWCTDAGMMAITMRSRRHRTSGI